MNKHVHDTFSPSPLAGASIQTIIAAHAAASSGGKAQASLSQAEVALSTTRATRPLDIAYKLLAAFYGADPDHPVLSAANAANLLNSPDLSSEHRLIISAFMDLYDLDGEQRRSSEAWDAALADRADAEAEDARRLAAYDAVAAKLDQEAPVPDILLDSDGDALLSDGVIIHHHPPFSMEKRERMLEALAEYKAARKAAKQRLGYEAIEEAYENHGGVDAAFEAIVDTPAPSLAAVTEKVRLVLARVHGGMLRHDVDTLDTISEFISEGTYEGPWPIASIYLDLLRLTGERPELWESQVFDASGFVEAFRAIPGHFIDRDGVYYCEPEAWPDGDHSKSPPGHALWKALTPWQRELALRWAGHDAGEREGRIWASSEDGDPPALVALAGREAVAEAWATSAGSGPGTGGNLPSQAAA